MKKEFQIQGQEELLSELQRIFHIFTASECEIRPHFILTGTSGSGKSLSIQTLAKQHKLGFVEINAAQLTKEGTSGNSLSKALSPLLQMASRPTIVFVDEFDKLFISGNSNDSCAHETTVGVQNEFLKVLESHTCSVYGDYGKYVNASVSNVLFVFAGAFNVEENITLDRLREMGIKTEFLGRVGLIYSTAKPSLESLFAILDESPLLAKYLELFEGIDGEKAVFEIKAQLQKIHEQNTLGARMINTLINHYFIKGGFKDEEEVREITFQKKLKFN